MNGWINETRSRPPDRWRIILDLGVQPGTGRRKQKWITFRGSKTDAKKKLRDLLGEDARGEFIEPSKLTLGEWLDTWLQAAVKPPRCSARTYTAYEVAVRRHLKPKLGAIPLQQLRPSHIDRYHTELLAAGVSPATCKLHHNVLRSSVQRAVRDGRVRTNVASRDNGASPPRQTRDHEVVRAWTAEEARQVLVAAKATSPQTAALVGLALDSGARRGELQGLRWSDVDLTTGLMRIQRQLSGRDENGPTFGPTKTRKVRALDLSAALPLLREHKRVQAELKLANRLHYKDHGLVFAQAWEQRTNHRGQLGSPLHANAITAMLESLIASTKVRRLTVHGLRHTSATLLLAAGVQPHVVQQRLGRVTGHRPTYHVAARLYTRDGWWGRSADRPVERARPRRTPSR